MNPSIDDYRTGRRFILCDLICGGGLITTPIVVVDVGALDAFADPRWTKLPHSSIRLHGFEPDTEECAKLNEAARSLGLDFHFHPVALAGRTGPVEFHRYVEPAANSFYPPNDQLISRWCYNRALPLASQFALLGKSSIEAVSLADWAKANEIGDVDFIKLNVQGAELDVIVGAGALLDDTIGMVVEQAFAPTYLQAPMFGKVYDLIESADFCMFDIVGMNRVARTRSPIHITEDRVFVTSGLWPHHQFFEGHFFYMRDLLRVDLAWDEKRSPSLEKCFKLACIAEAFGQVEYAFEILDWIAASPAAARIAPQIRKIIEQGAATYRRASVSPGQGVPPGVLPPDARDAQVVAHMCTSVVASAGERVAEKLASLTRENLVLQGGVSGTAMLALLRAAMWVRQHIRRFRGTPNR